MSQNPPLQLERLFGLQDDGIMVDKLTGARVFVLSRQGWKAFNDELEATFFDSSQIVLGRMGYAYGKALGKAAKKMQMGPAETFEALFELATVAGWGKMFLSGGDMSKGIGILKIEHCVFCESILPKKAKTCHFLPGVVQGVAEEVTGKAHSVREGRCVCEGFAACEIDINLTDT